MNPKNGKKLQYRLKCSSKTPNWFFWIYRNLVDRSCSSFSTLQSPNSSHQSLCSVVSLIHLLQYTKKFHLEWCLNFKLFSFIWDFFCVANSVKAVIEDVTKRRGSDLQKENSLWIKDDAIETDLHTWFPINFAISVSSYRTFLKQVDSKSSTARFLNSFCSSRYEFLKLSNFAQCLLARKCCLFI